MSATAKPPVPRRSGSSHSCSRNQGTIVSSNMYTAVATPAPNMIGVHGTFPSVKVVKLAICCLLVTMLR